MFTTEKEANTKRCQESFAACEGLTAQGHTQAAHAVVSPIAGAGNSYARHTAPFFCIGSRCMAWRWAGMRSKADPDSVHVSYRALTQARRGELTHLQEPVGYCGKAGKP
jgi:hypothetical protein